MICQDIGQEESAVSIALFISILMETSSFTVAGIIIIRENKRKPPQYEARMRVNFKTLLMKKFAMLLCLFVMLSEAEANHYSYGELKYSNAFHAELLGHGWNYSVSYEFFTLNQEKRKTSFQVGLGYHPFNTKRSELWVPMLLNKFISFKKHHLEISLGHVFLIQSKPYFEVGYDKNNHFSGLMAARIGYRYQKPKARYIYRIGFTPFIDYLQRHGLYPYVGFSIGYAF